MNIKYSRNRSPRLLIAMLGLGILIAVALTLFFFLRNEKAEIEKQNNTARAEAIKNSVKTDKEASEQGLPDNPISTTTEEVPTSAVSSVTIVSASQSGGYVRAKATTSGLGTCVFLYTTVGDKPVAHETQVSGNTCESVQPEIKFSKLGEWRLKVTYYSNGEKAEDSKDVTIQ